MAHERFLNQDEQPDNDQVRNVIGKEVLPVWDDVVNYLDSEFSDYEPEMVYYNAQHGWALRWRKKAHQLCMLFPERSSFTALITLSPEEDEQALEKIHFFNARIRSLLNRPSTLPQGRWLWMSIEDHTDFVGFKFLLDLKNV